MSRPLYRFLEYVYIVSAEEAQADSVYPGADLDFKKGSKKNITFNRRYLDPNRVTYEVRYNSPSFPSNVNDFWE